MNMSQKNKAIAKGMSRTIPTAVGKEITMQFSMDANLRGDDSLLSLLGPAIFSFLAANFQS